MPVNQKKVGLLLTWKSEEDDPDHKSVRILSRHASSENVLNRRFNLARCFFTSTWTRSLFVKIQQRREERHKISKDNPLGVSFQLKRTGILH